MKLTKENLLADREVYIKQADNLQAVVSYIDNLLKFMDAPEPSDQEVCPDALKESSSADSLEVVDAEPAHTSEEQT